jgi:hypothetical protein
MPERTTVEIASNTESDRSRAPSSGSARGSGCQSSVAPVAAQPAVDHGAVDDDLADRCESLAQPNVARDPSMVQAQCSAARIGQGGTFRVNHPADRGAAKIEPAAGRGQAAKPDVARHLDSDGVETAPVCRRFQGRAAKRQRTTDARVRELDRAAHPSAVHVEPRPKFGLCEVERRVSSVAEGGTFHAEAALDVGAVQVEPTVDLGATLDQPVIVNSESLREDGGTGAGGLLGVVVVQPHSGRWPGQKRVADLDVAAHRRTAHLDAAHDARASTVLVDVRIIQDAAADLRLGKVERATVLGLDAGSSEIE